VELGDPAKVSPLATVVQYLNKPAASQGMGIKCRYGRTAWWFIKGNQLRASTLG
jgi:hypothetical protein